MNNKRIRLLQKGGDSKGPVVYWMSRDQRVHDNWTLIFAQKIALEKKLALVVIFNLVPDFLEATIRHYGFMLNGLKEVEQKLMNFNIPFYILSGQPEISIPDFLIKNGASFLISDFDPLKIKRKWKKEVAKKINIPFYEADAHNIVPCLVASDKAEFAAYTIRPKIHKRLPEFLDEFELIKKMKKTYSLSSDKVDWARVLSNLNVNRDVQEVDWIKTGEIAASSMLRNFLENKLDNYADERNDPNKNVLSNLSPYLHFGQISAQRVALTVQQMYPDHPSSKAFLEELIVRRELSDNFCYFNKNFTT